MNRFDEVQKKLESVRAWLQRNELEALLLNSQANFAWLTGGGENYVYVGDAAGEAYLLVVPDRAYLLTNNIEARRLQDEEVAGLPFEAVTWPWHRQNGAIEETGKLCDLAKAVSDLGSFGLPKVPDGFTELRYTMLPPEIERYRRLGQEAAQAVEAVCLSFAPGDSELAIAAALAHACRKRNILPLVNLVGGDERIARYRHPLPTENPVRKTMLIALTGRRQGLHISLTRLVSLGPVDPGLLARHRSVAAVDARYILESQAGVTLGEVVTRAIEQYALEGFPQEWELHHQGGLTGYSGREIFGTPEATYRLQHDQALTWNPSITGAKSEDTFLLSPGGPEILTRTGSWPELDVDLPVGTLRRPAILIR
ncbi:MAG: aminopeptidase P family N-terminal domain-containing protein [Chloroflexi bacterium]|nr:aminopeptidase P family N-terminal domain-containing protein [Chloroflexota bacterium]